MKISEQLAEDFQEATRSADRATCPDAEALSALAAGEIPDPKRGELLDHIVACSDCAVELRLAKESASFVAEAAPAESTRQSHWRWLVPLAAALALATLSFQIFRPESPDPVLRGASTTVDPASGSVLNGPPKKLTWPAQPGAEGYRARLLGMNGEDLLSGPWSNETILEIPPELRESLHAGNYQWTVDLRGQVQRRQLGPFSFRLE